MWDHSTDAVGQIPHHYSNCCVMADRTASHKTDKTGKPRAFYSLEAVPVDVLSYADGSRIVTLFSTNSCVS